MAQASNGRSVMVQGRIVFTVGDLFKGRVKTVFGTQTPRTNQAGEPMMEYGFGLAVPKTELAKPGSIWEAIHAEAQSLYPGGHIPPSFAMKYKDGDGIDDKGVPFAQREGYAGHLVFACTTSLPIKWFRFENGNNIMVNDGIKAGDYVNVQLSIKAHPAIAAGKAGLYLNPNAVQFLGYGKEIVNAPSGDQIFGTSMPPVPQGASSIPIAQPGMLVPNAPNYAVNPGPIFQPGFQQPVAQQQQVPHYGILPVAHQPPPGGQPMAQPQQPYPVAPQMAPQQPQAPQMPVMPGYPQGYPQQ